MSAIFIPASRSHVYAGILFTSVAYFLFTVHDAAVKLLVVTIPVWQVLFFSMQRRCALQPSSRCSCAPS
jgi:hypothetical protein